MSRSPSNSRGVRQRRGRLAADDRRGFVDEGVILEASHHEQGKVHPTREVARQDTVADTLAPYQRALALALFDIAAAHHHPERIAGKDAPPRFYLVVDVHQASELFILTLIFLASYTGQEYYYLLS